MICHLGEAVPGCGGPIEYAEVLQDDGYVVGCRGICEVPLQEALEIQEC